LFLRFGYRLQDNVCSLLSGIAARLSGLGFLLYVRCSPFGLCPFWFYDVGSLAYIIFYCYSPPTFLCQYLHFVLSRFSGTKQKSRGSLYLGVIEMLSGPSVLFGAGFLAVGRIVESGKKKWMQDVKIKRPGICTGEKYGSKSCPAGSRQYALASSFRKGSKTSAAHRKAKKS
jgi:hypothetical protein